MSELGQFVELARRHLEEMTEMHLSTQRWHAEHHQQTFRLEYSREQARQDLERFVPRWLAFDPFNGRGLGLEKDGLLSGYLLYQTYQPPLDFGVHPGAAAVIVSIAVADACRRQGVGSALVEELAIRLSKEGVASIESIVWTGNKNSEALFSKANFEQSGEYYRRSLTLSR